MVERLVPTHLGPTISIDDPADPRISVFLGLRDHAARQARELPGGDMARSFIAEGDLVIERALSAGFTLRSVLVAARRNSALPDAIDPAVPIFAADDVVLTEITGRPELRDPIADFDRAELPSVQSLLEQHNTFAVLEGINNPNNLGVIMRNAAGLGIDAILLDPTCGDPLYRRAIRASMGQVFALPHARLDPLPHSLGLLRDHEIETIALTPQGNQALSGLVTQRRVAVLLGAEGPGLTEETMAACTHRVRIPMSADVDSLNVAAASAIAFHHIAQAHR